MKRRALPFLLALAASPALLNPASAQPGVDRPQPTLPEEPLTIITRDGTRHEFRVEMAIDAGHQTIGLMFRPSVAPNGGMLFDWGAPRESMMWMRNTISSLDMVFITQEGRILRIAERTTPLSLDTIASRGPVRATLELAAGTAERLNLRPGDRVEQRIFNAPTR
ncbi:DUF192 domain-containing protein [Rhodovarius crocodyli]|uniref:DUF192 domain-containing protein n=1 Tax=Rhodovarius crocodyli TaxID=1979269 RepID=A0A437MN44_9PROT|nr:DUF192 domain-containing protein [Rhodovarius crocodyli]RVT99059.1 DUF192 domain-containing protein [Rhodovarius crocodyli]